MTRDEHRSRIGASMAPAVLGVSPYKDATPLGAYLFFTGQSDGPEETPEMAWGLVVEEAIQEAAEAHFDEYVAIPVPRIHKLHQFMGASPDGFFINNEARGLEIKNVTDPARAAEWGEPGTDQIPTYTMVQVQQQAAVFDFEVVEVAVSLFGRPPVFYSVPRRQDIIDRIIRVEASFWLRVQERRPPEPDWTHPDTPRLVEMLRKPEAGKVIELPPEATVYAYDYLELATHAGELKRQKSLIRARLIDALGDAEIGLLGGGWRLRRRLVHGKTFTTERKDYYTLDILKGGANVESTAGSGGDDGERADGAHE